MDNFSYIAYLAQQATTTNSIIARLKTAQQIERLIRSTVTELKIEYKKNGGG